MRQPAGVLLEESFAAEGLRVRYVRTAAGRVAIVVYVEDLPCNAGSAPSLAAARRMMHADVRWLRGGAEA